MPLSIKMTCPLSTKTVSSPIGEAALFVRIHAQYANSSLLISFTTLVCLILRTQALDAGPK